MWSICSVFFSTIFRQFQANTCRNSELEEKFGWVRQKNCWVRAKFARFLLDFGSVSLFLQGFCLKIPKFWVRWWKSAELASKYAWVRPKNRSELGAQNRKKTLYIWCILNKFLQNTAVATVVCPYSCHKSVDPTQRNCGSFVKWPSFFYVCEGSSNTQRAHT